jgi:predicted aconitase with swiveling domain
VSVKIDARPLVAGTGKGELVMLSAPLSLWGGYDFESGRVCDTTHPDVGVELKGKVVAMSAGRGSSSASSALVESIRLATAPAAIILAQADPILLIGGLVGYELYDTRIPIVVVESAGWRLLQAGVTATVDTGDATASITLTAG